MKHRKDPRKETPQDFDGDIDPDVFFGEDSRKADWKALRLCSEVARALSYALAGECGDDLLRDLMVQSVTPAPNASRLLVTVCAAGGVVDPRGIIERLGRVHGILRSQVAAAINRKRAPELAFRVAGPGEVQP